MTDWEKRARELIPGMGPKTVKMEDFCTELVLAVLQLGREMAEESRAEAVKESHALQAASWNAGVEAGADARADEIAKSAEAGTWLNRAEIAGHARSFISKPEPKKTREQVLEEALSEVYYKAPQLTPSLATTIKRALDWKP